MVLLTKWSRIDGIERLENWNPKVEPTFFKEFNREMKAIAKVGDRQLQPFQVTDFLPGPIAGNPPLDQIGFTCTMPTIDEYRSEIPLLKICLKIFQKNGPKTMVLLTKGS